MPRSPTASNPLLRVHILRSSKIIIVILIDCHRTDFLNSGNVYVVPQYIIHPISSNSSSPFNSGPYCQNWSFRIFLRLRAKHRVDEATIQEIGSVRSLNHHLTFLDNSPFPRFKTETETINVTSISKLTKIEFTCFKLRLYWSFGKDYPKGESSRGADQNVHEVCGPTKHPQTIPWGYSQACGTLWHCTHQAEGAGYPDAREGGPGGFFVFLC